MIEGLKGKISILNNNFFIIEVQSIFYKINSTEKTIQSLKIGSELRVFTHLEIKEPNLNLYGFLSYQEIEFFRILRSVSGLGPKTALAALNYFDLNNLKSIILNSDINSLAEVSGISLKGAQKIILEIRGQLDSLDLEKSNLNQDPVFTGLKRLGYQDREIKDAFKRIKVGLDEKTKLREILKILSN